MPLGNEDIALRELRRSAHVQTTDANPFLAPSSEEVEGEMEEEEEEEEERRHPPKRSAQPPPPAEEPRQYSRINLLTPPQSPIPHAPLIICLHGSNDSCMRSWLPLIEVLYKSGHRILLYDRPAPNTRLGAGADLKPHRAVSELRSYLYSTALQGPYVFVAHAYGGCIARLFVQQKAREVAGMVLVGTGQETALAAAVEAEQSARQILGDAPVSVVRGNALGRKQEEWVRAKAAASTEAEKARLVPLRVMLERWDGEDERMRRQQLALSRRSRFTQVREVGHHVIRDRPDVVVEEVRWVMQEIAASGEHRPMHSSKPSMSDGGGGGGLGRSVSSAGAGLKRGLSTRLQRTFTRKGKASA